MNQRGGTEHLLPWVFNSTLSLNSRNALCNGIIAHPHTLQMRKQRHRERGDLAKVTHPHVSSNPSFFLSQGITAQPQRTNGSSGNHCYGLSPCLNPRAKSLTPIYAYIPYSLQPPARRGSAHPSMHSLMDEQYRDAYLSP